MMLCGSILGLLLAQGFVRHDLRMVDVSHLCGAVQMTKKALEGSKVRDQPFLFVGEEVGEGRREGGDTGSVGGGASTLKAHGSGGKQMCVCST